eukprot:4134721-Karenia_brevis.AAC.1
MARDGSTYTEQSKLTLPANWTSLQYWKDLFANIGDLLLYASIMCMGSVFPDEDTFFPRWGIAQLQ